VVKSGGTRVGRVKEGRTTSGSWEILGNADIETKGWPGLSLISKEVKIPTLSQKTRQGWGTRFQLMEIPTP
jgi:hypothetical protein